MGGDELNLIEKGKNYGFPIISYGREYSGDLINGGLTAKEGLEQPNYFWTPSIAPSGMTFYSGKLFTEWQGNLFFAAMSPRYGRKVIRLEIKSTPDGMRVAGEEFLMAELNGVRFKDVKEGPDGGLYVAGPEKVYRLAPKAR